MKEKLTRRSEAKPLSSDEEGLIAVNAAKAELLALKSEEERAVRAF
jgi:hypothetical protein